MSESSVSAGIMGIQRNIRRAYSKLLPGRKGSGCGIIFIRNGEIWNIMLWLAPRQEMKHCSGWIKIGRMCGRKPQGGERKRKEGKPRSKKYKEKWKGR